MLFMNTLPVLSDSYLRREKSSLRKAPLHQAVKHSLENLCSCAEVPTQYKVGLGEILGKKYDNDK